MHNASYYVHFLSLTLKTSSRWQIHDCEATSENDDFSSNFCDSKLKPFLNGWVSDISKAFKDYDVSQEETKV